MATKPTRLQQQACDHLAEALYTITEAFRLDGRGKLDPGDLDELARLIEHSVVRRRGRTLALYELYLYAARRPELPKRLGPGWSR